MILPEECVRAVLDQTRVKGAPHDFYKYPARFSPRFAQQIIATFTEPGDVVLDPFCGGGTTLVEALAGGRKSIGFDVSSLASFISSTKTTPILEQDVQDGKEWASAIEATDLNTEFLCGVASSDLGAHYEKNLPSDAKQFFTALVPWLELLPSQRLLNLARLTMLRVGQISLDCKSAEPSFDWLKAEFLTLFQAFVPMMYDFSLRCANINKLAASDLSSLRCIVHGSAEDIDFNTSLPSHWATPKLILTSPPSPGVHVLYHRWQINGRRETAFPFWLAAQRDGDGESFYTMGSRSNHGVQAYYKRLTKIYSRLSELLN